MSNFVHIHACRWPGTPLSIYVSLPANDLDMAVNTDKSYCVSFWKQRNNEKIFLTLNDTDLVWKNELKYLNCIDIQHKEKENEETKNLK